MAKFVFRKLAEEVEAAKKREDAAKELGEQVDALATVMTTPAPAPAAAAAPEEKKVEETPVAEVAAAKAPEPVQVAPAPAAAPEPDVATPVVEPVVVEGPPVDPPQSQSAKIVEAEVPKDCPFVPPTKQKRLKIFLWGPSGVGKTCLALQFPAPAVIDTEKGTKAYEDRYTFRVLPTSNADEMMEAVLWLDSHKHPFRTLVIDPITTYWESLQRKWSDILLMRNQSGRGFKHEFYDMQIRDWSTVKSEYKEFLRRLLSLDMNVIVTAHSRALYAEGETMKKIGETYDAEKKTEYAFDVILRLSCNTALDKADPARYVASVEKDRFGLLPAGRFPTSYSYFAKAFGETVIAREATPFEQATQEQVDEIIAACAPGKLNLAYGKLMARLRSYGADSFEELSKTTADTIIAKLRVSLAAMEK